MTYNILIYAGTQTLTAIDIEGDKTQYISMHGNTSCHADKVDDFYENILDYYNVDDLAELNASVQLLNGGTSEENIKFLTDKFAKLNDFNIWMAEKILPIVLLERNAIDKNGSLPVKVYDKTYMVTADEKFDFTVELQDGAGEITLTLHDFTVMNHFNGTHFHGDEEETKRLQSMIEEMKGVIQQKDIVIANNKASINEKEKTIESLQSENQSLKNGRIELTSIIGDGNIKDKLQAYVDVGNDLGDYDIREDLSPKNDNTIIIAVQNNKTSQSYTFTIPNDTSTSYTSEHCQNDIYKKIAHAISTIEENNKYNYLRFVALNVGDKFNLGRYDGQPITWRVLKKGTKSMYVLADKILCERRFDTSSNNLDNSWNNSEIRKWLNNEFYNVAFYEDEKSFIGNMNGYNITLLSLEEAGSLMTQQERVSDRSWWLRPPGPRKTPFRYYCIGVYNVLPDGSFSDSNVSNTHGVRPALNLEF